MVPGARQLPVQHLSIRVPWHDSGWAGTVCKRPRENTSCLVLKNIGEKKNDAAESGCAGCKWEGLAEDQLPACKTERGSFMASFAWTRRPEHPYVKSSAKHKHFAPTPYHHPAYSAACVPFRWMLKGEVEDDNRGNAGLASRLELDYRPEREPDLDFSTAWVQDRVNQLVLLDTFFSAVQPQESLCFFYAKLTPLADDHRRVIVGVARVLSIGEAVEYRYTMRAADAPLRCVLWERNVGHSLRPGFADGFLLPYQEILEAAAQDASVNPADYAAFAPEEHVTEFSYAAEHVSHGAAIASLLACAASLRKMGTSSLGLGIRCSAGSTANSTGSGRCAGPSLASGRR